MKPVLIQTLIRRNKQKAKPQPLPEEIVVDTATPLTKFIFWALAAIVILSILLA